jgi:hypothetical protein
MSRLAFRRALADILGVAPACLKESDTRETVETWTSIADVQIMTMIASDLGVEPDAELLHAETIGELLTALEGRFAFR